MTSTEPKQTARLRFTVNEDWLSVIIAFLIVFLCAIGLLGPHGIKIVF